MHITQLRTIDPASLDDDDTWVEACSQCGAFDNFGELVCRHCDD
jgi:hypothetical protein